MTAPRESNATPPQSDGGGDTWRPSIAYLALALLLVLGSCFALWRWLAAPEPVETNNVQVKPVTADNASGSATTSPFGLQGAQVVQGDASAESNQKSQRVSVENAEGDADPTRDLRSYVVRGEKPTMPEVIDRLHQAGIYTGLGAFSPPGTRPPLVGLAVPEDFVLPEGYVRHHQATDDGQRIEAILMYAPDREFFDAAKRPIVVPKDRVVPPEHAPPGLPIRRIVIPAPLEPGKAGS